MAEIPDFFHALTAWRKFDTTNGQRMLTSAGHTDHVWPVADLGEAYCRAGVEHDAPELSCSCGFYCYKERTDAEQHAQGTILAKVEVWGRLLAEHKRGYRAQHMKILELYVAPGFAAIDALTKRYGVAVFIYEGASKWISESPSALSSSSLYASGWNSLPLTNAPYLPYNPNTTPSPSQWGNQIGALSGHAIAALQQYQNQSALNGYNAQYQQQLQNYLASQALTALSLAPKAPYMMMPTKLVTMGGSGAITVEGWYDDIDETPKVTTPEPQRENADPEPDFDPVADRVNARLQETA